MNNQSCKCYVSASNTHYPACTAVGLVSILEDLRNARLRGGNEGKKARVLIEYEFTHNGELYFDGDIGYIGRSLGSCKVPLLIKTSRSLGGELLNVKNIVKIERSRAVKGKREVLWEKDGK